MATDSTGNMPIADSPESITHRAVKYRIGYIGSLGTSGAGTSRHRLSIWVAVITGLPSLLTFRMSIFLNGGYLFDRYFYAETPRAIIMPSAAFSISSMC